MKTVGTMSSAPVRKPRGKILKNRSSAVTAEEPCKPAASFLFFFLCTVATRVRQVAAQSSGTDRQERKRRWRPLIANVQTNQVTCVAVQVKQFAKVSSDGNMTTISAHNKHCKATVLLSPVIMKQNGNRKLGTCKS